jgi:hypothetical protein
MLGTYNYNQVIRKCVVGFGTLFNNLEIRKFNDDGSVYQRMKVPLAYGPSQKFLARLEQQPDLGRPNAITLPRLSFEMTGMSYDPARKQSPTQYCLTNEDATGVKKTYIPVPYNLEFELNVLSKTQDDCLQIVEQIIPFFQPSFNLSIKLVEEANIIKDVPIIMNSISFNDDYEGNFDTRRALVYTLRFTVKTYIYGPTTDTGLIKKAITKEYAKVDLTAPGRYRKYQVTPKAKVDKNNDNVVDAIDDSLLVSGDDFGFNETSSFFEDL